VRRIRLVARHQQNALATIAAHPAGLRRTGPRLVSARTPSGFSPHLRAKAPARAASRSRRRGGAVTNFLVTVAAHVSLNLPHVRGRQPGLTLSQPVRPDLALNTCLQPLVPTLTGAWGCAYSGFSLFFPRLYTFAMIFTSTCGLFRREPWCVMDASRGELGASMSPAFYMLVVCFRR